MPDTQEKTLAISALVGRRCRDLGLSGVELVHLCGYKNISKGLGRLEQLHAGDFKRTTGLVRTLAVALDVPVEVVNAAVEETQRYIRESADAAWRAAFRPHAVIMTERERPSPAFIAAFIGVNVLLRVDLT
jgi:hypothetical protein